MSKQPMPSFGSDGVNRGQSVSSEFETTQWGLVQQAGRRSLPDSQQALSELCTIYWLPLYVYVRRRVGDRHEAQDITQAFFTKLLEKDYLRVADPARGRFRAFLLTALKRFMSKEWSTRTAKKRGGVKGPLSLDFAAAERGYLKEPVDSLSADQIFLKKWARTLLEQVFSRLESSFEAAGKAEQFGALKVFITPQPTDVNIAEVAARLGMTEGAVRTAGHRLRRQYRVSLRYEIARTLADPNEVDDEVRSLFQAFGS